MQSFEIPTVSAISRTFNQQSANTRSWIFCYVILRGSHFRGTWAWLIKNQRVTTVKLVKPIFYSCHQRRRVTVHSIQALFDFAAQFPFQKQELNHRPILLFFHFSKIRGHACFHTWSKQYYESNLAEMLTVAA
jgi:hypothetical protein